MSINQPGVTVYVQNANGAAGDRFNAMAIGSGATAEEQDDTQLVAEHTADGAERKAAAVSLAGANNEKLRFVATFALTTQLVIREVNITNDQAPLGADTGAQLMREVFNKDYNAIPGDTVTLTLDAIGSDNTAAQSGLDITMTWAGIAAMHKLNGQGLADDGPIVTQALGRDATAPALGDTGLGDEIVAADSLDLGRGEYTQNTQTLEATNGFTDTVRSVVKWAIETAGAPSVDVDETSLETNMTPGSGVTLCRITYDATLTLDGEYADTFEQTIDYIVSIA